MGRERVRQVVDAANELRSDLTVVLGDFFRHAPFRDRARAAPGLGGGAWRGCTRRLASTQFWAITTGGTTSMAVRHALDTVHLPVMQNDAVLLGAPGGRFWLAGLGDQIAYRLGPSTFKGVDDLPGTLARVRTDDPVILLAHEPDIFTEVPARVALTIAGHTHGGQIRLPYAATGVGAVSLWLALCLWAHR